MALTVTAHEASANAFYLRVLVLTSAVEAGGNSATARSGTPQASLTPAGSNSLLVWAVENFTNTTVPTVAANNTALDASAGLNGDAYAHGYYSAAVTSGTPVTVGCSASGTAQMAAYEIKASGASTPTQDASAPALATSHATGSVTTASFTPPAGSVLVAVIACNDSSGTPALTVTDTSGLTWTQRVIMNQFNQSIAAVYTATVPAGGGTSGKTPPISGVHTAPGRGPSRAWAGARGLPGTGNPGPFANRLSITPQPHPPLPRSPAPRRAAAGRAGTPAAGVTGANAAVTFAAVGPPAWKPQPRPRPGVRSVAGGIRGLLNHAATPPPRQVTQPRRGPGARALWRGITGTRLVVPGAAVPAPAQKPQPRRPPGARGQWRGKAGPGNAPPPPVTVAGTWTASRQINGPGFGYGRSMIGSLDCPVSPGSGTWLIAICSWTLPPGFLGATMEVADDVHGFWIPLGAPNGDSAATGYTRCSIWARPGGSAANPAPVPGHVYLSPAGLPGPVYPAVTGVTVIEVSGMSPYAGIPAVIPASSNAASAIAASAPAPTSQALMVTVAASDGAAFSSTPGGTWTPLTGVSVTGTAPVILHTAPAWQVASTAQAAAWATSSAADLSACTAIILTSNPAPAQANPDWPSTQLQAAFGSGALTPRSQMTWTDISSRFLAGQETSAQRGKNRQLDQIQAAQISLTLDNSDSALDPGNVNSPYWPDVVVDTPIRLLMTWEGRTYSQFFGYVSKWPQQWKQGTRQGLAPVTATDSWSFLIDQLSACQQAEMLLTGPYSYWTCGDSAGSAYAANYAPGNTNVLQVVESKSGALTAVADFGADSGANDGDPSGTLWSQSGLTSGDNGYGYCLVCSDENYPTLDTGVTVMGWFNPTGGATQVNANLCLMRASNAAIGAMWQVDLINPASGTNPGGIQVTVWDKVTRAATNTVINTADFLVAPLGGIFHIAMVITQTSWQVIVNGGGFTGGSGSCNLPPVMSWLSFMGTADRFATGGMFNGECCHLGVFGEVLPADRVAQIVIAGYPQTIGGEFATENPSSRIERLMAYGGWSGPRAISTTSATKMAAITDIQGSAGSVSANGRVSPRTGQQAGQAITNIVASDNGFMAADGNGVLCYQSRGDFYGRPPAWYVGELTGQPLNANWSLVQGTGSWTVFGGASTFAPSSAATYLGYPAGLFTPDGVTAFPGVFSEFIPVTAGTSYLASVILGSAAGFGAGWVAQIKWYNSAVTQIGTSTGTAVPIPGGGGQVAVTVQGTAPGGAATAVVVLFANGTPGASATFALALPMLQPAAAAGTAGEYPAQPDITFSEDKALLYTEADLTQSTGTGVPVVAANDTSTQQHGQSPFTATVYQYDQNVVADEANWIVSTQSTPVNRFETVTVDAAANPANWPFVLGAEPGDPLQVARRPVTAQSPTVVRGIAAQVTRKFDFQAGVAQVTATGDTFPEGQILIADDPKYGQLGQGYYLAW